MATILTMKKYILRILILILSLQSCTPSNDEKDKLIGNWSVIDGNSEFEFYKDSLIVNEFGINYINSWNADGSKIFLKPIKGLDSFGIKEPVFDYRLSNNNDTLYIKRLTDSLFRFPIYRIKNSYDYWAKQLKLTIDLPSKNDLISSERNKVGMDVYVGFRNGKLIAKTDSDKTHNLEEIKREIYMFIASVQTEIDSTNFQFNLFTDKNIDKSKIDSIKSILKSTQFQRIFRIYNNDKVDYKKTDWKDDLNWHGVYE